MRELVEAVGCLLRQVPPPHSMNTKGSALSLLREAYGTISELGRRLHEILKLNPGPLDIFDCRKQLNLLFRKLAAVYLWAEKLLELPGSRAGGSGHATALRLVKKATELRELVKNLENRLEIAVEYHELHTVVIGGIKEYHTDLVNVSTTAARRDLHAASQSLSAAMEALNSRIASFSSWTADAHPGPAAELEAEAGNLAKTVNNFVELMAPSPSRGLSSLRISEGVKESPVRPKFPPLRGIHKPTRLRPRDSKENHNIRATKSRLKPPTLIENYKIKPNLDSRNGPSLNSEPRPQSRIMRPTRISLSGVEEPLRPLPTTSSVLRPKSSRIMRPTPLKPRLSLDSDVSVLETPVPVRRR